jgi:putative hydrolase of the HAD superfamily
VGIRAVFFDAGETILHAAPSFPELFAATLEGRGHGIDPELIRDGLYAIPERFVQAAERGERWTTSPERSRAFWTSVYDGFLERVGLPVDDGLQDALYEAFTTLANYELFDDVPETFRELHALDLRVGLVSNFERWLEDLLVQLEVRDALDVCVISGIEGVEKPDPAIFRLALDRSGLRPDEVVYVGDVPEFDVDPAISLGMSAVLLDRRGRHPGHPGLRLTGLSGLSALVSEPR